MLSYQLILMSWGLVHLQLYVLFYREWSHNGGLLHMVFAFTLLTGPVSALVCAPESAVLWPWLPRSLPSPPSPWRVALPLNSIFVLPSLLGWHVPVRGPYGSPPSCLSVSSVWASTLSDNCEHVFTRASDSNLPFPSLQSHRSKGPVDFSSLMPSLSQQCP